MSKRLGYLEDALSVFRQLHDVTPDSADVMSQVGRLLTFAFRPIVFGRYPEVHSRALPSKPMGRRDQLKVKSSE